MIWSVLAMTTGTEPTTVSVPFKVLLATLLAVARVDTRINKDAEGSRHTGRGRVTPSILFACSARHQSRSARGVF